MDAAAWLAEFAQREARLDVWRAAAALRHQLMGDRIRRELHPIVESHSRWDATVVLDKARELDCGLSDNEQESDSRIASSLRTAAGLALSVGWATRVVGSVAAVPGKGVVDCVTLRCRRHDERLWAAWWNGSYDCGWYVGPTGLEQLMASRISTRVKLAASAAAKRGDGSGPKIVTERGLLDAIEGRRLQ